MKNRLLRYRNKFNNVIVIAIGIVSFCSVFISIFFDDIFILNENQLLYLFSAMAQIIGSIFGLTLTAYVFFADKFKDSTRGDDIYYDATTGLIERYITNLGLIACICGVTIFLCIFGIITLHNWKVLYPFIINESVLLFLLGVISILVFGIMVLDPRKLDKEIAKMKKKAEEYYETTSLNKEGDFRLFLKHYNLLERVIIEFANTWIKNENKYVGNDRPQIIQALRVLYGNEIIPKRLSDEIHELRMYRNALVHGIDFNVSQMACERVEIIYNALEETYQEYMKNENNSGEWKRKVQKLFEL